MRIDAHPMRIGRCIRMANPSAYMCTYMCKELHLTFPFCLIGVGTGVLYAQHARKGVKKTLKSRNVFLKDKNMFMRFYDNYFCMCLCALYSMHTHVSLYVYYTSIPYTNVYLYGKYVWRECHFLCRQPSSRFGAHRIVNCHSKLHCQRALKQICNTS